MSLTDELIKVSDALKEVVTDRNENYIKVSELRKWCESNKQWAWYDESDPEQSNVICYDSIMKKFCGGK